VNPSNIHSAARELLSQRLSLEPISALPEELQPQSISEGYAIQAALNSQLTRAGLGDPVGHKIGCTTPVMQAFVNIKHPCAGQIFSHTVMHGHGSVPRNGFVKIGMECEIAVQLAADLPAQKAIYTQDTVSHAVGAVMAAIELVDERYDNYSKLGIPTLIADDFFNAGCVLGEPVANWRELDLAALVGVTTINGIEAGRGQGALVMGHPLNALAWLANSRAEHGLPGLKAGEFVLLGSVVETKWLNAGDRVKIDITGLGSVSLDIEA
jgi:2-oxo-3-hexenedioate decarboxylase/2-keto-4-pentenoate hydratase